MRVLIVTQYFWPENFRINQIVESLVDRGVDVEVLTGKPNYPEGKIFQGYRTCGCQTEQWKGALVHRVPLIPRGRNSAFGLLSNYIDLNKTSAGAAFSANCRFYYTASNDPPDSKVYQFDLSAANIPASAIEIHTIESPYHPFQLGPDGKIYIPSNIWNSADLDVIQNPDLLGLSCNYTVNSFNLAGKTTKGSLPNIISGLYGGCDFATSNTSVQIKTRPDISVIPNPFSNYTIFTIQNIELKNASIDILNVLGEKVDRITEINTNEIIFKRNELKSGIYFVKIISGNEVKAVSKFMIE